MDTKKQTDKPTERQPDKMAGQRPGSYDPTKPDAPRRQPEAPEDRKEFEKPEGSPFDKPAPKSGGREGFPDEGERSDRSAGRPIQLEKEDDGRRESAKR